MPASRNPALAEPPVRPRRRGSALLAVALVAGAALACAACGSGSAQARTPASRTVRPTTTIFRQPGDPRAEICSDHTAAKIDGQLAVGHVVGRPTRAVTAAATTCTYPLDGGSLRMTVFEAPSLDDALAEYKKDLGDAGRITDVPYLGSAAFTDASGTTVTIKDHAVLTVDVSHLPQGNDRPQIAQSLSFEVLTTFDG